MQLKKWNKTHLAVLLGYETIIWQHQSQNLGFSQVLIRAHCVTRVASNMWYNNRMSCWSLFCCIIRQSRKNYKTKLFVARVTYVSKKKSPFMALCTSAQASLIGKILLSLYHQYFKKGNQAITFTYVFSFYREWYFVTKIVLTYCEKNFWNSRLKAENFKNFWDH